MRAAVRLRHGPSRRALSFEHSFTMQPTTKNAREQTAINDHAQFSTRVKRWIFSDGFFWFSSQVSSTHCRNPAATQSGIERKRSFLATARGTIGSAAASTFHGGSSRAAAHEGIVDVDDGRAQ
jgi:hypothetical protein